MPADHKQRASMSVVSPTIPVLTSHAPELGHGENYDIIHPVAEIGDESRDGAREIIEPLRELTRRPSLIHMRVPAADIGERDFQSHVGLDQLRDLQEPLPELRSR